MDSRIQLLPILFNVSFDFIVRKVLEEAVIEGVKLAHGSSDFFHGKGETYELFELWVLMYADDLVAMFSSLQDLDKFILTSEKITQKYELTMSVKKTMTMSMEEFEVDSNGKLNKQKKIQHPDLNIVIRNQKVEITDKFTYLGCAISRDQKMKMELEARLTKATTAFNMLRNVVWYRKNVSISAKLKIFRSCVLPVLLYGSETWCPTVAQEKRFATFYMKCLRTLVGLNLGDRAPNQAILQITGQPAVEGIMRRNRLRWFGHVNIMVDDQDAATLVKKTIFSYLPNEKRPGNVGVRKRWEHKIIEDLEKSNVKNWRRETIDRDSWRAKINTIIETKPVNSRIKPIVQKYKSRADERRSREKKTDQGKAPRKVVEVLVKDNNKLCGCPNCKKKFKPQGITGHVRSCAATAARKTTSK
ncbi:unnamed protein product [Rotaria socialis]|uniref:Reverse transcriptase domain-containing protein n=1 Tax=Rotaria socialis TaxID=392032 RepID=A0A817VRN4_9BILA|nr:unnamed protein product [Rotaria socialis]CAF4268355.1 unnamed protein product [Rotaria socialis]